MSLTRKQQRTQLDILTALKILLQTHPFDQITIAMICEQALIHHSTFYRYFTDKYALLQAFIADAFSYSESDLSPATDFVTLISDRLLANWTVFENLTRYNHAHDIYYDLIQLFSRLFSQAAVANPNSQEPIIKLILQSPHPDYATYGLAGSIVGTFIKWNDDPKPISEGDLKQLLKDVLADYQQQLQ
ncbi:TetR/AcrR family transcriptional regulator [Furfurilactobacillus siliginis]|uniref:HTH tetR-type domain-containing protein n=1 Tax=Furfurilactobacillus siliginis TaxID=348151 RepID=A0A0R2L4K4_9LACO|nr:TetR/AcrR family transcriptional regulator [Furfurilactobacillus siliginis]KRN96681.1 hypothetical protein IV55_GL001213 [Furfurilactobacillus siliginis]GEK29111.1 hypothetical protein LSI01_14220 [Furfurilactobacillus siliginis]